MLNALASLESGEFELPPGCEVTYDLEAMNILKAPAGRRGPEVVRTRYRDFRGIKRRQAYRRGNVPRGIQPGIRPNPLWFVAAFRETDGRARRLAAGGAERTGGFLDALETTGMTRSYKMLTLLAMLNAGAFPGRIEISELVSGFRALASRNAHLAREAAGALVSDEALRADLERNPIAAWTGGDGTGGVSYFTYGGGYFASTIEVSDAARVGLQELTREIADWRLAAYLSRRGVGGREPAEAFRCKVSRSGGNPILFLPDRAQVQGIPEGWTEVRVGRGNLPGQLREGRCQRRPEGRGTTLMNYQGCFAAGSARTRGYRVP